MKGLFPAWLAMPAKNSPAQKALLLSALLVVGLGMVLLPQPAEAGLKEIIQGAAAGFMSVSINIILWALNWVSVGLVYLSSKLLSITLAYAMTTAYTPIADNANTGLIAGWELIRDLANMSFILILIAIGIGTMLDLRIRGGFGPKLLVPFTLVALLINFSPLLTGIIIDIANILTKVFFDAAAGGLGVFNNDSPFNHTENFSADFDIANAMNAAFSLTIGLIFNLVTALVLFMVSALVLMRVLALWLLVIFSPLAFAMYILPATRSYFEKWWHLFLQWTFMVVPVGLFIWLAILMASVSTSDCTAAQNALPSGGGGFEEVTSGLLAGEAFCTTVTLSMALGTMVAGMLVAFSISATGAGAVVRGAQKAQVGALKFAGQRTRKGAVRGARAVGAKPAAKAGRALQNVRVRTPDIRGRIEGDGLGAKTARGVIGVAGLVPRAVAGTYDKTVGEAARGAGTALQGPQTARRKEWEEEQKRIENQAGKDFGGYKRLINSGNMEESAGALNHAVKNNNDDLEKMIGSGELSKKRIGGIVKWAKKNGNGAEKAFLDKNPTYAQTEEEKKKIIQNTKPEDMPNLGGSSLEDPEVIRLLHDLGKINKNNLKAITKNMEKMNSYTKGLLDWAHEEGVGTHVDVPGAEPAALITKEDLGAFLREKIQNPEAARALSSNALFAANIDAAHEEPIESALRRAAREAGGEAGRTAGAEAAPKDES